MCVCGGAVHIHDVSLDEDGNRLGQDWERPCRPSQGMCTVFSKLWEARESQHQYGVWDHEGQTSTPLLLGKRCAPQSAWTGAPVKGPGPGPWLPSVEPRRNEDSVPDKGPGQRRMSVVNIRGEPEKRERHRK